MNSIPRLAELLSRNNWRDAKVVALNQEAKTLLAKIEQETDSYVKNTYSSYPNSVQGYIARYLVLGVNIDFLNGKKTALERSVGHIKSRLSRDPDVEIALQRLQSEVTRYRIYTICSCNIRSTRRLIKALKKWKRNRNT
jgi:uncharacterized protein involved in exopolysaccharide biosynthesis